MLDMSSWNVEKLDVTTELRLDPRNVRLGVDLEIDPPQSDIIQSLFQFENAMELAKAIASVGFLTHERPVVLRDKGQWIVVEGNRRTAALKALLNPYLVPALQPKIAELAKGTLYLDRWREIECIVAPTRQEANQLIASLHTSNPRKPWGPLRQAEFFASQLSSGKTVEQLIEEYPGINVAEFIETAEMHRLLKTVEYQDEELSAYARRRNFPISTFERLYKNPEFLDLAALSVDPLTGQVSLEGNHGEFGRLVEKIVGDIRSKRINTRVLNAPGEKTYKRYLAEIDPLRVSHDKRIEVASLVERDTSKPVVKRPRKLDTSDMFAPAGFPAVGDILSELRRISYVDYPNATFDLIRTFLEKSIKAYAEQQGVEIPKKGPYVYLDSALEWLRGEVQNRSLEQVIDRLRGNGNINVYVYGQTGDYLNAANHNHQISVTKDEVLASWNGMINLLRFVLQEAN